MSDPTLTIFRFNNNTVFWEFMDLASDGSYVNDATVTMTLKDADDANVTGAVALTMPYVTGSNGQYQGVIPYNLDWNAVAPAGSGYHLVITATGTQHALRTLDVTVSERTS